MIIFFKIIKLDIKLKIKYIYFKKFLYYIIFYNNKNKNKF